MRNNFRNKRLSKKNRYLYSFIHFLILSLVGFILFLVFLIFLPSIDPDLSDLKLASFGFLGISIIFLIFSFSFLFMWGNLNNTLNDPDILQIESLDPYEFEEWIGNLFKLQDYKISITPKSGDFGIDVIATKKIDGQKYSIGIQVKKTNKPVGIQAVQEVISGLTYYGLDRGIVATNSEFYTESAKELAEINDIELLTILDLAKIIKEIKTKQN